MFESMYLVNIKSDFRSAFCFRLPLSSSTLSAVCPTVFLVQYRANDKNKGTSDHKSNITNNRYNSCMADNEKTIDRIYFNPVMLREDNTVENFYIVVSLSCMISFTAWWYPTGIFFFPMWKSWAGLLSIEINNHTIYTVLQNRLELYKKHLTPPVTYQNVSRLLQCTVLVKAARNRIALVISK